MNEEELNKTIDEMTRVQDLLLKASEKHLVVISQLREKVKDLEFELKDLRVEIIKKNTYIEDLNAQIFRLEKELLAGDGHPADRVPAGLL